jgi:hypothetical protein
MRDKLDLMLLLVPNEVDHYWWKQLLDMRRKWARWLLLRRIRGRIRR